MGSINEDIALLKAQVKGYYRRNPKTGKREHVKPHKTKTRKTREEQPKGQQQFGDREKYPDGRLKPREGDTVYQVVGGPFGGAEIVGTVYRSKSSGKLRVKLITRSAGTIIGRVPVRGKHYALNEYWTVKGDPAPAKAAEEKTRKYEEEKAATEKFYSEGLPQLKARLKKEGHTFLDEVTPVKGMAVEDVGRVKPGTIEFDKPLRGVVTAVWEGELSAGHGKFVKVPVLSVLWDNPPNQNVIGKEATYRGAAKNDPYGAEYKYFRVVKKKKR